MGCDGSGRAAFRLESGLFRRRSVPRRARLERGDPGV